MRYTRIAIDIDDTLADSTEALRRQVNLLLGEGLSADDYKQPGKYWGYYRQVWERHGIADKLDFHELKRQMEVDQSHVPLISGADTAMQILNRHADIYLVTSRDQLWENATRQWFRRQFANDDISLHFCESHKDDTAQTKGQLCKELGAELLIDDNPEHCRTALDEGIDAMLFGNYGWHHGASLPAMRCRTWTDVVRELYG